MSGKKSKKVWLVFPCGTEINPLYAPEFAEQKLLIDYANHLEAMIRRNDVIIDDLEIDWASSIFKMRLIQ
jgi:hypothetical protein